MELIRKWLLGAGALAMFVSCSESDSEDPTIVAPLAVPEPVVAVEGATATIRWISVDNAHHYAWEWQSETEGTVETGNVYAGQASFEMAENVIYRFRVQSVALPGSAWADSEWSEYVTASSNMLATPAPALVAASLTDTSATLEWSAVADASGYKYELTAAGSVVKSGTTEEVSVAFENELSEGTAYRFRVMALTAVETKNDSPWSDYVTFSTRRHEVLAVPVVTIGERTASSAEIAWAQVEGAVKYVYKLYDNADLTGAAVNEGETTQTTVTIGNLAELTYYYFTIQSVADAEDPYVSDSEFSKAVEFRTKSTAAVALDLELPEHEQDGVIRAFPGAEGAGMYTTGGRGGAVYHVTNLNDSGAGSLREAVGKSGARTIVFDVAGTIELNSTLKIANGNLTIAGQTAPGDGICIKGYGVEVNADNVIIRYLRIRPGDMSGNDGMDALGGRYMENVIIDHCSLSWSTDECVSFYVNRNMTMQYCLAYESLRNGKHNKGTHGYGGIWGGAPASFHHNILAHHDSRNPRLDSPEQYGDGPTPGATAVTKGINRTDRLLDFRNNVIYNFCNYPAYGGVDITMNFVGNCYKWGPASINGAGPNAAGTVQNGKARMYFCSCDTYYDGNGVSATPAKCVMGNHKIYFGDNTNKLDTSVRNASEGAGVTADNQKGFVAGTTSGAGGSCPFAPVWASTGYEVVANGTTCSVTTHSADDAFNVLVSYCGASLRQDAADRRVLADVKNGTGVSGKAGEMTATGLPRSWNGLIDSQEDVGGWPTLTATDEELARVKDTDGDGIPDYYEDLFDLNSNDPSDAAKKTLDPQGLYSNLEIYLHYLVKDITKAQVAGGSYGK